MSDIFQEVDEEVRRDQAAEFWAKYQNHLFALAALIILATAGYRFYDYRQTLARQTAGATFQEALKLDHDGKTADSRAMLDKLDREAPAGYRMLGRFTAAGETEKSDPKAGAEAFDAIADDSSFDAAFRDAARLRAALARLDAGEIDAAKGALETLAAPDATYRNTARLTLGSIALSQKDYAAAGKWLDAVVSDPAAPQTERGAAETLLGLVASNAPAAN